MSSEENIIKRKIVIVGDGVAGKTSLLYVFTLGQFPTEYVPTVFENLVTDCRVDGKAVQLGLWDTAGQEEYDRMRPLSYSKANVILIGFALDNPESLRNIRYKWYDEVTRYCPGIPIILVGLKKDLRLDGTSKYIQYKQGLQMAQAIGARKYVECSSLTGEGVDNVFEVATRTSLALPQDNSSGCCTIQ
ncbi:Rho family GTPase [Saccharomycopsis crataegensis]|uniref:GTP-binding protein RHO4 n=1 Tax=Saccharomycopsis crataegensis TaxID=43959 RepID=A0AAV5QI45_9ASCO|nr:Rho family GTPase [Saccharomycopsis crataegensis]